MDHALLQQVSNEVRALAATHAAASRADLHSHVQRAIAGVPACVLIADEAGRLVAASRVALDLLGYSLSALRGLDVTDVSADEEEAVVGPLWETFLRQRHQSGRYLLRRRDGSTVATRYVAEAPAAAGLAIAVHVPIDGVAETR